MFMEIHIFARYACSMNFRIFKYSKKIHGVRMRITVMQMSKNDGLNVC